MDPRYVNACEVAVQEVLDCRDTPEGEMICDSAGEAPGSLYVVNTVLSCTFSLTGIVLNGLMAYTIISDVRFHTAVNAVVVALTATNLLLLTAMVPFTADHFGGWYVLCSAESVAFLTAKETLLTCFTAVAVLRFMQVVLDVTLSTSWHSLLMAGGSPLMLAYALVASILSLESYQCQALSFSDSLGRAVLCLKPPRISRVLPLLLGSDVIGTVITAFCYGAVLWKVVRRTGGCLDGLSLTQLPCCRNAGSAPGARELATLNRPVTMVTTVSGGAIRESQVSSHNVGGGASQLGARSSRQESTLTTAHGNTRLPRCGGQSMRRLSESAGRRPAWPLQRNVAKSNVPAKSLPSIDELSEMDEQRTTEDARPTEEHTTRVTTETASAAAGEATPAMTAAAATVEVESATATVEVASATATVEVASGTATVEVTAAAATVEVTSATATVEVASATAPAATSPRLLLVPVPVPVPVSSAGAGRVSGGPIVLQAPSVRRMQRRVDVVTWISSCSHLAAMLVGLAGPALISLSLDKHTLPFTTSGDYDYMIFQVLITSLGITHLLPVVLVIFCSSLREATGENIKRLRFALLGCFF